RSMTSPAAILVTTDGGSWRMRFMMGSVAFPPSFRECRLSCRLRRSATPQAAKTPGGHVSLRTSAGPLRWQRLRAVLIRPTCENRSEEHTSELQSRFDLVCRLLLEKKNYLDQS